MKYVAVATDKSRIFGWREPWLSPGFITTSELYEEVAKRLEPWLGWNEKLTSEKEFSAEDEYREELAMGIDFRKV